MSRSLTRVLVVAVLTALPLASRTYAADSGAGALLDTFGIFALDELRTRGFTDSTSSVGVNQGDLHSGGALVVSKGTVAANSVHLGGGSVCKELFANVITLGSPGCAPAAPLDGPVLGVVDPADACGFPKAFPACGGPAVSVPHGSGQVLPPGTYGDVLVQGGGAGAGTLILNGGHYIFCSLRVSRYARLFAKAATEIDVAGDVAFSNLSTVGPAPGSAITARDLKIFVNGGRVRFARKSKVHTKLCAPKGALFMNDGASLEGCALAERIHTDRITVNGTCVLPPSSTTTTTTDTTTTSVSPSSTTITTTSTTPSSSTTIVQTTSTIEVSTTTPSTSSTTPPVCGNDTVDPGEDCDGSVPSGVFCLDSAGGAVLVEAECPICTTGANGCKLDCSCCPTPGQCGTTSTTTSSTISPETTLPPSTTLPTTTTSIVTTSTTGSSVPPTTTSTTTSTSSTAPPPTTSTTTSTSSTAPPTTTTSTSTSSTAPPPTTSTSTTSTAPPASTTSTSTTSTSTTVTTISTTSTTTTIPVPLLAFTIGDGTANCGGAGLVTPPAAPLSGQILDGTSTKLADLGLGCLYFGGGKNTSIPGGIIPTGSTTFFRITGQNGNTLTLGGASGPSTSCTKGAGPNKHCVKGEAGTDGLGACTSDADCLNHGGSCVLDANCFFGPPLSIPNPGLVGTSTCVLNVIQNDVLGLGDVAAGSASVTMTLASRVYLTGASYDDNTTPVIEACPRCISGTCNKGANQGKACATTAANFLSLDCPPLANQFLATLPIALNPFTTGATSITSTANGVFCPNQTTSPSSSLNAGALGKTTVRSMRESGTPAGNITDHAKHKGALGSTFCIPATGNSLIDPVAGLPGPGALSVTGTLQLQ